MSLTDIYVPRLSQVQPATAQEFSPAYLRGLAEGLKLAERRAINTALWWYDTGHHVGLVEGKIVGYREGREHGFAEGLEVLVRGLDEKRRLELTAHHGALAELLASSPSFAELCDMRGDHQRAERQRQILAERGIEVTA